VLQTLVEHGISGERHSRIEQRSEIDIGDDATFAHERCAPCEHRRFGGVTTDRGDQRQLIERLVEWNP
jgi:hypothetical protein